MFRSLPSERCWRFAPIIMASVVFLRLLDYPDAFAQSSSKAPAGGSHAAYRPGSDLTDLKAKEDMLDRRLDSLTIKVDSELKSAATQFEAIADSTNRAFTVLALLGAFGSFIGGLIVVLSWLRGRKVDERHRQDYERERQFYEASVFRERQFYEARGLDYEKRQNETHSLAIEIARKSADRESSSAAQQFQLGESFLSRSGEMLSKQIDGIAKLGDVIELVRKTFDMQLTRVGDVDKLVTRFTQTDAVLNSFTEHFRNQYKHVRDLITTFKDHSRMAWTRLTNQEEAAATRALTTFETIPQMVLDTILTEDGGRSRLELASIYELLGISAFYTNDIDEAVRCLERGLQIYGSEDAPAEHLFPQAFCCHFLGLVEKNWCHLDRPAEANLASAQRHLEEAARRLQTKKNEFLTPLTLAEVLSYSEPTREAARSQLETCIERLTSLKEESGLDANQDALLGRALLMRGNIDYLNRDMNQALNWYGRANSQNAQSAYAILSMAQATTNGESEVRVERFRTGLKLLEGPSGPLSKREASTRISALAWANIAAREVADEAATGKYIKELEAAGSSARPVGRRVPLFFCPIEKTMVTFGQLRATMSKYETHQHTSPKSASE